MVGSCVRIEMCNKCAVDDKSKPNFSHTHLFHLIDWLDDTCDIAAMAQRVCTIHNQMKCEIERFLSGFEFVA